MKQPTTSFTFRLLYQFHQLHLEGKISTHDFMGALHRISDNAFPQCIPVCLQSNASFTAMLIDFVQDPTPQFRMVMHVWRFLTATKCAKAKLMGLMTTFLTTIRGT
jgi:hypothetical protein